MDERKNKLKKIGITSNVITDRLGVMGYSLIKKAGFTAIDFNMQRGFFSQKENSFSRDFFKIICKHSYEIINNDLFIAQTHAPYYTSEQYMNNPKSFDNYLDAVEKSLHATLYLSCKRFVIHPLHKYAWMKESEIELTKKMIERIFSCAKQENIYICLENLPYDLCGETKSHIEYLNYLKQYNIKACFDTGHSFIKDDSALNHLVKIKKYTYAVHIHQNDGTQDLHSRISVNSNQWYQIINELKNNNNVPSFSLETSGIYKGCDKKKIQEELVLDYKSICSYINAE